MNQLVYILCEGQTEEEFVKFILAPHFYELNLTLSPRMLFTSKGQKGGALNYDRVKPFLDKLLKDKSTPVVTTLIDLYALNPRFPDYEKSKQAPNLKLRLEVLNKAWHKDIVQYTKCHSDRFIPYIQAYEFEALLFSDIDTLTSQEPNWAEAKKKLAEAHKKAGGSPENINDGPTTKPAALLEYNLKSPAYKKSIHGPRVAEKIGLDKIKAACPFFAQWLIQLRELAPS